MSSGTKCAASNSRREVFRSCPSATSVFAPCAKRASGEETARNNSDDSTSTHSRPPSSLASFTTPRTCDCGESPPRHRSTSSSTRGGIEPERDDEGGRGPLLPLPPAGSPSRSRIRTTYDSFAPASARSRISSFVDLEWTHQCVTWRLGGVFATVSAAAEAASSSTSAALYAAYSFASAKRRAGRTFADDTSRGRASFPLARRRVFSSYASRARLSTRSVNASHCDAPVAEPSAEYRTAKKWRLVGGSRGGGSGGGAGGAGGAGGSTSSTSEDSIEPADICGGEEAAGAAASASRFISISTAGSTGSGFGGFTASLSRFASTAGSAGPGFEAAASGALFASFAAGIGSILTLASTLSSFPKTSHALSGLASSASKSNASSSVPTISSTSSSSLASPPSSPPPPLPASFESDEASSSSLDVSSSLFIGDDRSCCFCPGLFANKREGLKGCLAASLTRVPFEGVASFVAVFSFFFARGESRAA
mmetsp:Transcript_2488/g.10388  ORF Transcript_2488/g.10388 Transcript_2488/m.10388 type:complete len:481 (-) Transcript_2488:520-1962(-)